MKSVGPTMDSSVGGWARPTAVDAFPAVSAPGPVPGQNVGPDTLGHSLPHKDQACVLLHQLSQTLISLRGSLELALLVDCDEQEYRRVIQQSLAQADGLVQLFKSYRAMAESESSALVKGPQEGQ
jgi:hypothetical protein